jgi:hypothetical protein
MKLAIALLFVTLVRLANAQAMLTNAAALRAIYGDYDPATETAKGDHWRGNDDGAERISIETLLFVQVNSGDPGSRTYVVTSAVPQQTTTGKYECHACAPEIGVGIFVFEQGEWKVESKNACTDTIGQSGQPPDAELVRIGNDLYGVKLSVDDMHMGDATTYSEIVAANDKSVSVVWGLMEQEDNSGDYDPTGRDGSSERINFSSAYRFVPTGPASDHYQIDVVSRGWGYGLDHSYRSQNWNATYRFKGGKYQLVKRIQFRELPATKPKPKR